MFFYSDQINKIKYFIEENHTNLKRKTLRCQNYPGPDVRGTGPATQTRALAHVSTTRTDITSPDPRHPHKSNPAQDKSVLSGPQFVELHISRFRKNPQTKHETPRPLEDYKPVNGQGAIPRLSVPKTIPVHNTRRTRSLSANSWSTAT